MVPVILKVLKLVRWARSPTFRRGKKKKKKTTNSCQSQKKNNSTISKNLKSLNGSRIMEGPRTLMVGTEFLLIVCVTSFGR